MSDNHLTLLGSQSSFFTSPDDARLESFPNRGTRPYTITLDTHEFSSLCPVTGQPDSCHLTITYVPAEKCVETKSLKYYLAPTAITRLLMNKSSTASRMIWWPPFPRGG